MEEDKCKEDMADGSFWILTLCFTFHTLFFYKAGSVETTHTTEFTGRTESE